ncbi:hypothetical protein CR970_02870 [Candidatus Saccharibacteria bacterium]|nr:MAG: hypothetical protein CR970_02870 [Candidatus Saccharibacteria bacterium]
MARPVILGNGSLTVGINEHGLVHDFYYPYVGLDNLTTARSVHHMIGVWVNGQFSWVDDGTWYIDVNMHSDALIGDVRMVNNDLGVTLTLLDFVDTEFNTLCRQVQVENSGSKHAEIRLFMHQVFEISRAGRADTAMYVPDEHYILDYKGRCSLLIYGQTRAGVPYDQFAIGNYGIEGKEGTFKDAEDGELSGSPVEHGGVDSVLRFVCQLAPGDSELIDYWVIASDSQYGAEKVHHHLLSKGLVARQQAVEKYWQRWLAKSDPVVKTLVDERYVPYLRKSLLMIRAHTDRRGGIIASADSSIYNYGRDYYSYVWPRDGAYAIWPLIRLGYTEEPKRFFEFCRDILHPDGYMMHKYQPDRAIGSTWHPMMHGDRTELPIQEDETAIVIYMLGEYYEHAKDIDFIQSLYPTLIQPMANFLADFIDPQTNLPHASYDLWEERFLTHTYTTAITYQALLVAAEFAELCGSPSDAVRWQTVAENILSGSDIFYSPERKAYRKGYLLQQDGTLQFDETLDVSSAYGVMMFGLYNTPKQLEDSIAAIENTLLDKTPSGGVPRYEHDHYFEADTQYLGNPWFITTMWLAQYYARTRQTDKARHYLDWVIDRTLPSGILSEQVDPNTNAPISVTPLVWSHAELVNTVLDVARLSADGPQKTE